MYLLSEKRRKRCSLLFNFLCSEWVLGDREDLAKEIVSELQPENGEVITSAVLSFKRTKKAILKI